MDLKSKIAFSLKLLCICCILAFYGSTAYGQKPDSSKISIRPKAKIVSKVPQIKANVQPYRPQSLEYTPSSSVNFPSITRKTKILTVLKVYPNPVNDQVNINLRLEREITLSVKITDLLGNDIVRLANEKLPAGEQTRTYNIPNKLNPGMYFIRIEAGGEPRVLKISVL